MAAVGSVILHHDSANGEARADFANRTLATLPTCPAPPVRRPDAGLVQEHLEHVVRRIAVRAGERLALLEPQHIRWVRSNGDWLTIHSEHGIYTCRMTMCEIERRHSSSYFLRIHRNAIVNLGYVREFSLPRSGNAVACLVDGKMLPISRSGRMIIRDYSSPSGAGVSSFGVPSVLHDQKK